MCFRSRRCYERMVRDLKDDVATNRAVIQTLSNMNFKQAVEIQELKARVREIEQDRDEWKDIAHQVDAARRKMLRRFENGTGEHDTEHEYNTGMCCARVEFVSADSYL